MDSFTFKIYASGIIYLLIVYAAGAGLSIFAPTNRRYMIGLAATMIVFSYIVWFINMGVFPLMCLLYGMISLIVLVFWGDKLGTANKIRLGGFSALNLILAVASLAYIASLIK